MAENKSAPQAEAKQASALKVHHLRPAPGAKTAKTRVGRGEGSKGKTAGRGTKGSKARYQVPERFEGGSTPLHMRLPKLRGFKNPFKTHYQVVNLDKLSVLFPDGGDVSVEDLVSKGAVRDGELVKVLGTGEITVAVNVTANKFSSSAKEKIEAAGGSAVVGDSA
ncbi:50S ribosomal protein L15 [Knoellia sp. S7-12]|uniref:50S ribosomal protein L15 n=1 Tax=Knoellia sp. S7-12 TaxID=3126698 RepID=UPI0033670A16